VKKADVGTCRSGPMTAWTTALGAFAGEWGEYSEHFKRAIFLIKSSTSEREEAMRTITLNRALDVVLQGTQRAHAVLFQRAALADAHPVFYFRHGPAARWWRCCTRRRLIGLKVNALELALLYDVLFPMATLVYAHSILLKGPRRSLRPTYRK